MEQAIGLATQNAKEGTGGPFGVVIVKEGVVIATGVNQVTSRRDPTAHAEMVAIRNACHALGAFQLTGCDIYTSCEPCPMCLGAIYWARPRAVYYAGTHKDAADAGFDDSFIYTQVRLSPKERSMKMERMELDDALAPFDAWKANEDRVEY